MGERYHLVCHDCEEEAMGNDWGVVSARMRRHEVETGHRLTIANVSPVEVG
jgi:hypothetical protein